MTIRRGELVETEIRRNRLGGEGELDQRPGQPTGQARCRVFRWCSYRPR